MSTASQVTNDPVNMYGKGVKEILDILGDGLDVAKDIDRMIFTFINSCENNLEDYKDDIYTLKMLRDMFFDIHTNAKK